MKTPTQMMLSALMDDLRDTSMMIDYAHESCKVDDECYRWFVEKARRRAEQTKSDYDYIYQRTNMRDKLMSGDDIAIALDDYLTYEVSNVMTKVEKLK